MYISCYQLRVFYSASITNSSRVEMFNPASFIIRSQNFEKAFHDAGQFYWGLVEIWLLRKAVLFSSSAPLILPRDRVQDMDVVEDWKRAECMYGAATS